MTDVDTTHQELTLAEEVEDAALDILRECSPKYWYLTDGSRVRTTWMGPDGLMALEHTETGHVAEFRLAVRATQLPAPGPEDDGATRAELADAQRYAMEPQPALGGKSPADLILQVLEAAKAIIRKNPLPAPGPEADMMAALLALQEALDREAREADQPEAGHWHPATWGDVKAGDRIRVGGQHEATVEEAVPLTWKGSGATQVQVKLEGRPQPYTMPPSGPVEVWTPSLPEWAAQAYLTLVEGGLSNG